MASTGIRKAFMLNPDAIIRLLTLNVDRNADYFTLFSECGQLLGANEVDNTDEIRSFTALVGHTWNSYGRTLRETGSTKGAKAFQHVKILAMTHRTGDKRALEGMIVEWEGMVGVIRSVKPVSELCV